MNLPNQFYKYCCTLWFSYYQLLTSSYAFFAFLLSICSSLFCIYLQASSHGVDFSLVFHYNTSKTEASHANSSLVFDCCTWKQATRTQCNWSVQSCGFESVMWLWIWLSEECWPHEFIQFMIVILWSCEYRYHIMKLFTTCSEIGWKFNLNWFSIQRTWFMVPMKLIEPR
jgi:hypothetical protein